MMAITTPKKKQKIHIHGLMLAAKQIQREDEKHNFELVMDYFKAKTPKRGIVHDHDNNLETDCVLAKMLELGTPLTLDNYIQLAYLGNPPDGIEEDGEFLASLPDVILEGPKRVQ